MLPDRFLAVDPGEDTGWSVWSGTTFVTSGTTKMWDFGDVVWAEVLRQKYGTVTEFDENELYLYKALEDVSLLVVEEWRLYPWVLKTGALDFDECRTARLIGALYQAARVADWDFVQQSAKIKEASIGAGSEAFFMHPLRENRHANDSCLHGWFYVCSHGKATVQGEDFKQIE